MNPAIVTCRRSATPKLWRCWREFSSDLKLSGCAPNAVKDLFHVFCRAQSIQSIEQKEAERTESFSITQTPFPRLAPVQLFTNRQLDAPTVADCRKDQ